MPRFRLMLSLLCAVAARAQPPTAPVVGARGVTNFFTQEPAPGIVGLGGLVQITGLNLGPPEGATASGTPWPLKLADVEVRIGGRPAPIYSVSRNLIVAQAPLDASIGLVDVVVRRDSGTSRPARVMVTALDPAVRTAKDRGYGMPWGNLNGRILTVRASGLGATDPRIEPGDVGPADTPAAPRASITAYVGGLRAKVSATASSQRPGEFDVQIVMPQGARPGDLISLIANRAPANQTLLQPLAAPEVQIVPLPVGSPAIVNLIDAGVNGSFLVALGARGPDGCHRAFTAGTRPRAVTLLDDCLTSSVTNAVPAVAPNQSDSIGALIGPPSGNAQSGISATVKIFSAASDPLTITLPSLASTLGGTGTGFAATLPGSPVQIAAIDPITGEVEINPAAAPPGGAPGAVAAVDIEGLHTVYATAGLGQGRIAVIAGDDPLKPTRAIFAVLSGDGEVAISKGFPAGWLPLLNAPPTVRAGQPPAAPPREPAFFDPGTRQFFALARAADASKDAFVAFPLNNADAKVVEFPEGWFATSCTSDIRIFNLELVGRLALAGSRVAEAEFKQACPGSGYLTVDLATATIAAIPLPDQGPLRVPSARNDPSLSEMNNYVYGAKLDTTRAATSDAVYVLDGVNGSAYVLPVPPGVTGFTDASLQMVPGINSLLMQTIDRVAGDQGLVLFNLDAQTAAHLPVPEGFTSVASLNDAAAVCCLATRKLVARALQRGGSNVVIYDLLANDLAVVPNPDNITSVGPPPAAAAGGGNPGAPPPGNLVSANSRANTVSAVAYAGQRQVGIMVVRVP